MMNKPQRGFTLVELMVVIVIIGVLAALAIPRFLQATNKSKATEFKPFLKQIYTLQEAYKQERDGFGTFIQIGFELPNAAARRFEYTTTAPALPPFGTSVALGMATPNTNGQLIRGINPATNIETNLDPAIDQACVNNDGRILTQSAMFSNLSSTPIATTWASCAP